MKLKGDFSSDEAGGVQCPSGARESPPVWFGGLLLSPISQPQSCDIDSEATASASNRNLTHSKQTFQKLSHTSTCQFVFLK